MDWRFEKRNGINGYTCLHGIFHPDRKNILVMNDFDQSRCEDKLNHICDGCCQDPNFPGFINNGNFTKEIE